MENHGRNDDDLFAPKNPMSERDEVVPSTRDNLAHFKKRNEDEQGDTQDKANTGAQQSAQPAAEPISSPVGIYAIIPDPPIRTIRVVRVQPDGTLVVGLMQGHFAEVMESGALTISKAQGENKFTRVIHAPGTWVLVELSQPTRKEQEDYVEAVNKFVGERDELRMSVVRAEQQMARDAAFQAKTADENPPRLGEAVDGSKTDDSNTAAARRKNRVN